MYTMIYLNTYKYIYIYIYYLFIYLFIFIFILSPQAMGGLPRKHAIQTFLGGLDCDFTGCGSGCPPGNSDLRLTS